MDYTLDTANVTVFNILYTYQMLIDSIQFKYFIEQVQVENYIHYSKGLTHQTQHVSVLPPSFNKILIDEVRPL